MQELVLRGLRCLVLKLNLQIAESSQPKLPFRRALGGKVMTFNYEAAAVDPHHITTNRRFKDWDLHDGTLASLVLIDHQAGSRPNGSLQFTIDHGKGVRVIPVNQVARQESPEGLWNPRQRVTAQLRHWQ
eukprot:Skav233096  [mRNA]  locus=scaffold1342:64351:67569:- [translate_table: standard]